MEPKNKVELTETEENGISSDSRGGEMGDAGQKAGAFSYNGIKLQGSNVQCGDYNQ